jgi:hypothetical protein
MPRKYLKNHIFARRNQRAKELGAVDDGPWTVDRGPWAVGRGPWAVWLS